MSTSESEGREIISEKDFKVEEGDITEQQKIQPEATLFIPGQIVDGVNGTGTRLVVTTFRTSALFQSRKLAKNNRRRDFNTTVNSRIISASIGGTVLEHLEEPVRMTFIPLNKVFKNVMSSSWLICFDQPRHSFHYETFNDFLAKTQYTINDKYYLKMSGERNYPGRGSAMTSFLDCLSILFCSGDDIYSDERTFLHINICV